MTTGFPPLTLGSWQGRRVLALLCAVAFLDFVDASITNVALPHILASARDRQSALGVWAAVAGLASAVGILLGGVLTEGPGWRWVMFVNPIACVLVIPAVLALLPRDRSAAQTSRFDLLGSAVVTGGMLLLIYALIEAPSQGWGAARTWWELAGAAVLLACFAVRERYARDPVLPLSILRVPGLAAANLTGLIGFAGMLSMFYFLTLYMQRVLGYSPVVAGAAYLPLTFGVGIAAGVGAKLVPKVGSRAVICAGALIAAAGLFLLGHVPVGGGYPAHILPGLLLVAAGVGPSRAGLAAAILNSCQQLGGALGLAIFSAAGTAQVHLGLARGVPLPDATTSGIRHALVTGAAFAAAAALIALATTNTHDDPSQTHAAEPQARALLAAAALEPIAKEI
jgi:predicted MFS family arabinose efflux permease